MLMRRVTSPLLQALKCRHNKVDPLQTGLLKRVSRRTWEKLVTHSQVHTHACMHTQTHTQHTKTHSRAHMRSKADATSEREQERNADAGAGTGVEQQKQEQSPVTDSKDDLCLKCCAAAFHKRIAATDQAGDLEATLTELSEPQEQGTLVSRRWLSEWKKWARAVSRGKGSTSSLKCPSRHPLEDIKCVHGGLIPETKAVAVVSAVGWDQLLRTSGIQTDDYWSTKTEVCVCDLFLRCIYLPT